MTLKSLVISVVFKLTFERTWCIKDSSIFSLCLITLFLSRGDPWPINTKPFCLLILVKRTNISNSWLLSPICYLVIDSPKFFSLIMVQRRLVFLNILVQILKVLSLDLCLLTTYFWLRSLSRVSWSLVVNTGQGHLIRNSSDIVHESFTERHIPLEQS